MFIRQTPLFDQNIVQNNWVLGQFVISKAVLGKSLELKSYNNVFTWSILLSRAIYPENCLLLIRGWCHQIVDFLEQKYFTISLTFKEKVLKE